jgi:HK97 family phage major capsid protein
MNTSRELRQRKAEIEFQARAKMDEMEKLAPEARGEAETEVRRMLAEADSYGSRADLSDDLAKREKIANETDFDRPSQTRSAKSAEGGREAEQRAAFVSYLRGDISARELRAMNVATDAKGGFTAPSSTQSEVQVARGEVGPMIDGANVTILSTDNGNEIFQNSLDDRSNVGSLIGEATEAPETDITLTQRALGAFKYTSGKVMISNELLQDSNTDIVALVSNALNDRIARILNRHFTNGTGSNQPHGIVTAVAADASKLVTTLGAKAVADELFALQHKVAPAYRAAGKWMFSDAFLLEARTLKDAEGRYIWQPGLTAGAEGTILGKPYVINPDMVTTAGSIGAIYGDLKGYTFRKVSDYSIKRSDELAMTSDQVVFVGFGRYDGDLMNPNCVAGLKIKA